MNVVLEEKTNCEVLLKVEVPGERVDEAWKKVAGNFARHAKLPGFRPGKAPRQLVESKYAREIREELTESLLRETVREAIKEKDLKVLEVSKVEDVDLGADRIFRYTATVVTSPEFELPDYEGVEVEVASPEVASDQIDAFLENVRAPHASYDPVADRPLAMGDFAVLSYKSSLEGKPLGEALENAPPMLAGRDNFWLEMKTDSFLHGFCEQLVGLQPGEKKDFSLLLPPEFPLEALRGKNLDFSVELHDIQSQTLPEWDDALAEKILPGKTLEELKEQVRTRLEETAKSEFENNKNGKVMNYLISKVSCELPARLVNQETSSMLRDIVEDNQSRGISEEELMKHEDQLVGAAQRSAQDRVRGRFILLRIAEKENLKVSEQEMLERLMFLSQRYDIPVKKLAKDLRQRDGLGMIQEDILVSKALRHVASKAKVVPPKA